MTRLAVSIVLFAVLLQFLKADAVAQILGATSRDAEGACEPGLTPPYFGEPLLQDLRYLLSFALGYACMRMIDTRGSDCIPTDGEHNLQINPLVLL